MVPYLDGERTPDLPNATGALTGLRSDTEPAQLARAAFEGVVCSLLDALDELERAGVATRAGRLFLVGGGARSPAYRRLVADLARRTVHLAPDDELVARGACIQAAAVLRSCTVDEIVVEWAAHRVETDVTDMTEETVDPDTAIDADAVRGSYHAATRAAYGTATKATDATGAIEEVA